jgi:hypothetical protein
MALDKGTNLYVPCAWSLMTGKSEYLYCVLLHEMVMQLKYQWAPSICVVDFEQALVSMVKYEFNNSTILGCFFHFKQALFKKMLKRDIPQSEIIGVLPLMGTLTLVPHAEIENGITIIQSQIADFGRWSLFWICFHRT